ncbi:MAG: ABC transporter permease subunit [Oscillospiraceae bacterium]|nr:ABC transporter permease subunit [Oscillospiraceae bacterium]
MSSTISDNSRRKIRIWSVAIWILLWHGVSVYVGKEVLVASPISVVVRLFTLVKEREFWKSVVFSVWRISIGLFSAIFIGVILAGLAARFKVIEELLAPLITIVTTTPVASITILMLIWVSSRNLSVVISFMMVLPVVYTNVLLGIKSTNQKLLEMADVFEIPAFRKIRYIYVSQIMPFFQSACLVGLGLCFKAGIAAEVIGIPKGSIGERLYMAKIYLATPDLFAWTLTIILISIIYEKVFMLLLRFLVFKIGSM